MRVEQRSKVDQVVEKNFPVKFPVEVAGIMSLCDFYPAPLLATKFGQHVDFLAIRYDGAKGICGTNGAGGYFHFRLLTDLNPFKIPVRHFLSHSGAFKPGNEMLRLLDDIKPKYVLQMDSDEMFPFDDPVFWQEFERFKKSDTTYMKFEWEMASIDGREVPLGPYCQHTKIYKWEPNLTYVPGPGFATPKFSDMPKTKYTSASGTYMMHWFTYLEEWEDHKMGYYKRDGRVGGVEKMYYEGNCYDKWVKKYGHTIPEGRRIEDIRKRKNLNLTPIVIRRRGQLAKNRENGNNR